MFGAEIPCKSPSVFHCYFTRFRQLRLGISFYIAGGGGLKDSVQMRIVLLNVHRLWVAACILAIFELFVAVGTGRISMKYHRTGDIGDSFERCLFFILKVFNYTFFFFFS